MKPLFDDLRDRYKDQTAYIVGKGVSLQYLNASYFKEVGPIIAINEAVLLVQKLDIEHSIYSLQKDGCPDRRQPNHECMPPMVYPSNKVTVFLMKPGYSQYCLSKFENKVYIDIVSCFNFVPTEMSARVSVAILKFLGCSKIKLLCCDSLTSREYRTFNPYTNQVYLKPDHGHYSALRARLFNDLKSIEHEIITPKEVYA